MKQLSQFNFRGAKVENADKKYFDVLKKEYLIFFAVAVIILFLILYYKPASKTQIVTPKVISANENQLPKNFPDNIQLNNKEKIIQAYDAEYLNSVVKQSTVVFLSSEKPNVNFDYYSLWAKENGWKLINSVDKGLLLSLYFKKNNEDLNITIRGASVNISHVKK